MALIDSEPFLSEVCIGFCLKGDMPSPSSHSRLLKSIHASHPIYKNTKFLK
jgi:hypothetical protein